MIPTQQWRLSSTAAIAAATLVAVSTLLLMARALESKHISSSSQDDDNADNTKSKKTQQNQTSSATTRSLPSHLEREAHKEKMRQAKIPLLAMKSPMYDNVAMMDQQNFHLANISLKKAKWYISKDLAIWLPSTPDHEYVIQLTFEPRNRSSDQTIEGQFNKSKKINRCVVCGDDSHHMRHYIVPSAYRCLFPERYKSHLSHDVVILCPDCHLHCERESQRRMNDIHDSVIPIEARNGKFENDKRLYQVRSSALALLRWREKIPPAKVEYHEKIVREYFDGEEDLLMEEMLQKAADVEYRRENKDYISPPELIVKLLLENKTNEEIDTNLEQFVKGWRRHFIDIARPRFLPKAWSIDSSVSCGRDDPDDDDDDNDSDDDNDK